MKRIHPLLTGLTIIAVIAALMLQAVPGAFAAPLVGAPNGSGKELWQHVPGTPPPARAGTQPAVKARRSNSYTLNRRGMSALLATAPNEHSQAARKNPLVLSLPNPLGGFESFAVQESPIMEPGLAAKHPEIKTYSGRGIDDPAATIRFDLTPLGFHASVRSPQGAWYIDPYYQLDDSLYVTYYGRDLTENPHGTFAERDADAAELSVDHAYYHAADTVTIFGSGFAANADITITVSDPEEHFAARTLSASSDELGSFNASFVADPGGNLETHIVEASDGNASAWASYQVVRDDDPTTDPPTGDVLRTYRLALITDPGYAAFFGGSANVTAAKVTLMNRVDQLYEDDLSITMVLVANNDLLNLDTWAQATAPNGPCGAAACFTQAQVTGCSSTTRARFVIGQIIGASNYDIGHLALGQPGGGVANLGVVGRSNKAGGCTGIPTPVGDFYAVDYVAHEMGHQFSGNHPFNGNQLNCSGGNRNPSTSVEPGSGSSIMAYAGICLTDDLQAHSDPYFSQRSQQEISTYTSGNQAAINEVQTVSLRHFGGGNEVQVVTFGPGYSKAATIQPLSLAINAAPSATSRGGAEEIGNTVTIATGSAHTLQVGDTVTIAGVGIAGYNGTWTVTAVPTSRSFQYVNPAAGLATSGGGTVTLAAPGATESGTTVTISTAAPHGRSVGDVVTIAGVGVAGYNGIVTITGVPTPRTFQYTAAASGLANSGGGSATFFSPFQVQIGGNDSAVIGGSGLAYNNANIQSAINAIPGFAGTVTVTGAASTGFTVTYSGASAGLDVPSIELVNLSCGGCFASVEETNHGGANDAFTLNYDGSVAGPFTNGTNYTVEAIQTALQGVSEVQTVSLAGYDTDGDAYTLNYNGADTVAITRGQNNTTAGIAAVLQGGNEQQAITFANFNAANAGNSYQVQIGGNLSAVLGNGGTAISNANVTAAINAIAGFAGTVTVSGASNTAGPTITFAGASANTDVPAVTIVFGACAGAGTPCTATNRENVKGTPPVASWPTGGTVTVGSLSDTGYTLTFSGNLQGMDVSQVTVTNASGVTGSSVETTKGTAGMLPAGAIATISGFGGSTFNNTGFQVTFGGALATTNVSVMLALQDFSAGASGFAGETDKGGAVDNKGGTVTPTGDNIPVVTAPVGYTIPLRTPFALTGSATDADDDPLLYSWEQNDRGGTAGASLLSNTKTNGPLFAMFPKSGQISLSDSLQYNSPGENHLTTNPTRVFPDLQQILDNNTNADTGSCLNGPIAQPVLQNVTECYSEFLPTSDYVGFTGVNASPLSLHFRLTARDGNGGTNSADTTLLLAANAGPFLVTSPNTAVTYKGGSTQTITWDKANTDIAPVSATNVKISLSTDGGNTYPYVLAASTANDGSEQVTLPNVGTTKARIKIEAVGNIFFDLSNADFTIQAMPVVSNSLGEGGSQSVQYSDSLSPDVTITATDPDSLGKNLSAEATGLPAGMSLSIMATTGDATLHGSRTWKVAGMTTAAPGSYPVSVIVTDETGGSATTSFTIIVKLEDADATYTGDMLVFTASGGSSANVVLRATVRDSSLFTSDSQPGDIRNATVTFKEGTTTLCGPLAAALINGDTTTGTASCTTSLGLGAHTISIYVNNYYTAPVAEGVVEVAQPDGSFVTGGGYRIIGTSGGTYKADTGSRTNFGFNVNYKNLKSLQGHVNIFFRKGGKIYQIKSTAIASLGIKTASGAADFRSKANLTDVTNPQAPVSLGGNLTLQVTMTDKGEPGTSDTIGITLWDGGTLMFSSEWNGAKTLEKQLDGGNLVVH